jgi:hypothetical protein
MLAAPACSKSHARSQERERWKHDLRRPQPAPGLCTPARREPGEARVHQQQRHGHDRVGQRRHPAAKCRAPRARRAGRARARSTSPGSPCGRRGRAAPLTRPAGRRRRPRRRRERPRQVALGMAHLLGEVAQLVEAEIREEDERGGAGHAGEPVGCREGVGSRPRQGVAGLRGGRPDQRVDAGAGDDAGRRRGSRAPQGYRRLTPRAP